MRLYAAPVATLLLSSGPTLVYAQGDVTIRVVDTGPGLCTVTSMPGNHYMVYDAGDFGTAGTTACFDAVVEVVPDTEPIDLLVLSHSDADHLGAVDEIIDHYFVTRIIRSGLPRITQTWDRANRAVAAAVEFDEALDINLRHTEFPPGGTYRFGDVFITFVMGFHEPPANWGTLSRSEQRNAGSIVMRLQYQGRSVLFTGDAVGRHIDDPANALIASEKFMIDMSDAVPIDSDVMIAPHHGADNGGSPAFIQAVSPTHVIFSAGHKHHHPRGTAAQRYLDNGVTLANIFRTDRGDNEGDTEWNHGATTSSDGVGDDDVEITISGSGMLTVRYR